MQSSTGAECKLPNVPITSNEEKLGLDIHAKRCFQNRNERLSRSTAYMIRKAQFPPEDDKHSDDMDEKEDEYANETNQRKLFHKHLQSLSDRRKKMSRKDNTKQYTSV